MGSRMARHHEQMAEQRPRHHESASEALEFSGFVGGRAARPGVMRNASSGD